MLDPTELQYDVDFGASVLIYDKKSKELVMVILHYFTDHPRLLAYLG